MGGIPIYKKYLHLEFKSTQPFYIYTSMYIYISTAQNQRAQGLGFTSSTHTHTKNSELELQVSRCVSFTEKIRRFIRQLASNEFFCKQFWAQLGHDMECLLRFGSEQRTCTVQCIYRETRTQRGSSQKPISTVVLCPGRLDLDMHVLTGSQPNSNAHVAPFSETADDHPGSFLWDTWTGPFYSEMQHLFI